MKKIVTAIIVIVLFTNCGETNSLKTAAQTKISTCVKKDRITQDIKYSYINIDWWEKFNDDILIDYINKAFENNHKLKMAGYTTEEYYQKVRLKFAHELPQLGAGFSPVLYKLPESNAYDWRFFLPVVANYEADILLKNHDRTKSAKKSYEMSLSDEKALYISTVSEVGAVYLNIIKLNNIIDIQNKIVQNRRGIYELMQKRNHFGLTSEADVVSAEKDYTESFTDLSDFEKEREKLLNNFSVIIGESPENTSKLKFADYGNTCFCGSIPTEISTEIIEARPDYIKAEQAVEKAGIDVRTARKEFLPVFNIAGIALFNASNFGSIFTTSNSLLGLGGSVFQPLFLGGAKAANLRCKKAGYEKALENYKNTNLSAIQEINDSLAVIKKDDDKLKNLQKQKLLIEKEYFYNTKKYENGIISYLDLLQSEENLFEAQKRVAIQQINNYINYIGLYKACGAKI